MFMDDISRQRRARARQQEIAEDIQYRQNMRAVNAGRKRIQALIEDYSTQAVAAEREGRHDRAVRLALETQRLRRYLASSGGVSAAMDAAHAVAASNRALAGILESSGKVADQAARMMDPAALEAAQTGLASVNESMRLMMEQSDMLMEDMADDGERTDEVGEAVLRQIMQGEHRERHSRLIRDTHRQLDRLQRARTAEK